MATSTAQRRPSDHVGSVGDNLESEVYVNYIGSVPNKFGDGPRFKYLMRDRDGNTLTFFGALRVLKGDRITIRGRVHKHDEYKGEKSTELRNLEVVEQ